MRKKNKFMNLFDIFFIYFFSFNKKMSNLNLNQSCGSAPPTAKDFQTSMKEMLEQIGADDKCKQSAETMFDSGSSSSGSNLQQGSASSSLQSSFDQQTTNNITNMSIEGPQILGASLGKASATNNYTANKASSNVNQQSQVNQLNLTQQQADAFSKGASKMASEGCGTTVINAVKIANIKQKMNCIVQQNMTSSTVAAKAGATIKINQKDFDLMGCMAAAGNSEAVKLACIKLNDKYTNSTLDIQGANFKQTVTLDVKNKVQLSAQAKTTLATMQKDIAMAVAESKLTSENGLSGLPQQAKDISVADKTISDSCTDTNINQKVQNVSISVDSNADVLIEFSGSLKAAGLVIDQNVMASVITEVLVNDAIEIGVTASKTIEDAYQKTTGQSLKSYGESLNNIATTNAAGNTSAIQAGSAGVTTAASNQKAVDAAGMALGVGNIIGAAGNLIGTQAKGLGDLVLAGGKAASDLSTAAAKGIENLNKSFFDNPFMKNAAYIVAIVIAGSIIFLLIKLFIGNKSKPASSGGPPNSV